MESPHARYRRRVVAVAACVLALVAALFGNGRAAGAAVPTPTPTATVTSPPIATVTPTAAVGPPPGPSPYRLPWPGGRSSACVQGNNGSFSHRGLEAYAWDFAMPTGSVVLAARGGVVRFVAQDNNVGGTNWKAYASKGNYVVIDHGDGTSGLYLHLMFHGALVQVGDRVTQGQPIAYSGATGFASGPHLHFMVEKTDAGSPFSQSLPARFADVPVNNGVPKEGDEYTSGNATATLTHAPSVVEISNLKLALGTPSGGTDSGDLAAAFVRDLSVADGSTIYAGQTVTKAWHLRNSGAKAWPAGTHLVLQGNTQLQVVGVAAVDQVPPGAGADVGVTLRAPLSAAGTSEEDAWRLTDAGGATFGDPLWLRLRIGGPLPTLPLSSRPGDAAVSYFPQTGHSAAWPFLSFYKAHGGLELFGYPRTEAIQEDGLTVQYFQRARFEYHRDLPPGQQVQLTLLGDELTKDQRPFPTAMPFNSSTQHAYFPQTQHSVHFGFLRYFQTHGGLTVFGYPTSEELAVNGPHGPTTVQYFQRARFEYHPEFAGTPYEVELGLLGDDVLTNMGWLPLPPGEAGTAAVPAATATAGATSETSASTTDQRSAAATDRPTATPSAVTTDTPRGTPMATAGGSALSVGQTATVTAAGLRVHSTPSSSGNVTGYLAHGERVRILALVEGWAQISVGQTQGWVSAANLAA